MALAALITAAGAIIVPFWQRRKIAADSADVVTETALSLITPLRLELQMLKQEHAAERASWQAERRALQSEISALRGELASRDAGRAQMQHEIDELRGGVAVLVGQLEAAGLKPRYRPKTGPLGEHRAG